MPHDPVNHPAHYTSHPSGIECIQITEHMGFNLGNALKYIWRADEKGNALEDLKKAAWYVAREIAKREKRACGNYEEPPIVFPASMGFSDVRGIETLRGRVPGQPADGDPDYPENH